MSTANETYTPASTTLDAVVALFFGARPVDTVIESPMSPVHAVVLCMLENAGEEGLSKTRIKIGLRFAFDREDSDTVAEAGVEQALAAGTVEWQTRDESQVLRLSVTGQHIMANVNKVFSKG